MSQIVVEHRLEIFRLGSRKWIDGRFSDEVKEFSGRRKISPSTFSYAGRLHARIGLSSDEFERKVKNIAQLPTHDHSPSSLFANINDRYVKPPKKIPPIDSNEVFSFQRDYEAKFRDANMKPPSAPKEDASWLQLRDYEVR